MTFTGFSRVAFRGYFGSTFPDAHELEFDTSPYYGDEQGPFNAVDGHTTNATYSAPAGTTQRKLVEFYKPRLERRWNCRIERHGVISIDDPEHPRRIEVSLQLHCRSDRGSISVNPDNLATPGSSFEVVVDHRTDSN